MRVVLMLVVLLTAAPAAADVMPSPGRPDLPDTPQPEPAPIPLEVALGVVIAGGAALVLSRPRRQLA